MVRSIAALAVTAALTSAAPARADVVDGCSVTTTRADTSGGCEFVSTGRWFRVGISHSGGYGFVVVGCQPQGGFAFLETYTGYAETSVFLPLGVCILSANADADSGAAWALP